MRGLPRPCHITPGNATMPSAAGSQAKAHARGGDYAGAGGPWAPLVGRLYRGGGNREAAREHPALQLQRTSDCEPGRHFRAAMAAVKHSPRT